MQEVLRFSQSFAVSAVYYIDKSLCVGQVMANERPLKNTIDSLLLIIPTCSWWRHQMETVSALLAFCAGNSPVTGEFPAQRPVTRSFDVFFDLRLDQQLTKQWRDRWLEIPSRSLWRHCNMLGTTIAEEHHDRKKYMQLWNQHWWLSTAGHVDDQIRSLLYMGHDDNWKG